jgi:phosphoglycerol transferase MdoB-like AlkP superfamily enzyme
MSSSLSKIRFLISYWLLWILVFEVSRISFILYNDAYAAQSGKANMLKSLFYGLRMDASAASYIILIPCFLLLISVFIGFLSKPIIYKAYTSVILLLVMIIVCCDLPAYSAWGYRLDASPLKYLTSPREAWASVSHLPIVWMLLGFALAYFIFLKLFNRLIFAHRDNITDRNYKLAQALLLILFTGLQILPLRGGTQLAPLNQSSVYFSNDNFSNLAAINAPWNFLRSLSVRSVSTENPFATIDNKEAIEIIDSLYKQSSPTALYLDSTINKPNIVLLIWESFSQKVVNMKRDGIEITPGFNRLMQEGIYFSNIYSTGDRTDKGIVSILSGYPSQPTASIIKIPEKVNQLAKLPKLYDEKGYYNSFYYGGELEFANMKAYLQSCGFHHYTTISDFDKKDHNSKWGAHDHVVKNKILADMESMQNPFFLTWLTLSSHEPFETPVPTVIAGNNDEPRFLNSLHYTDSVIFELVKHCKRQEWWKNTVLIIIADHGHRLPVAAKRVDDFKIPMLWLGGALKEAPININTIASQADLPATLAMQFGLDKNQFPWSKNIFSQQHPWAYFSYNNAFGYVTPSNYFIYDNVGNRIIEKQGNVSDTDIKTGKAVLQQTFADYLLK